MYLNSALLESVKDINFGSVCLDVNYPWYFGSYCEYAVFLLAPPVLNKKIVNIKAVINLLSNCILMI